MNDYTPPIDAIDRALSDVGVDELLALPAFSSIDRSAVRDVLEGFGQLAAHVVAPSDRVGDTEGATLDRETGRVSVPAPLAAAFRAVADGGWLGLAMPTEYGGGGFPRVLGLAVHEMFGSANMALSLNPMLTQSAVELLERWGDERQRSLVIPRLVDGTWSGTMNLTEPDAGSDLGAIRTTATPRPDGTWSISGTKIYITWGEHELTDNIIHLVLARTPGAPVGTKGISVFLVPAVHFGNDGSLGERNRVICRGLEHKLGIHASPTCVMEFDGAVGEMVGPECGGMEAMFTMMNPARLAVGVQGVSIGERARQQAVAYASERRQGRAVGSADPEPSLILDHPDVRRTLADLAVTVDAARLLTYATAVAIDLAVHHPDEAARARAQRRADLLTPLAKAWPTDQGVRMASAALQVHGGMGFVEETGIAQRLRDARIAPIYEGTNGIQAIDLVGRKTARDGGLGVGELLDEAHARATALRTDPALGELGERILAAIATARRLTDWVVGTFRTDPRAVLTGATAFLESLAIVAAADLLVARIDRCTDPVDRSAAVADVEMFLAEHLGRCLDAARVLVAASTVDTVLAGR